MTNRGSIAEKALIESGLPKKYVSERLNISPKTLYNKLQRPDLEYDFIMELYRVIKKDFVLDFPELGQYVAVDDQGSLEQKTNVDESALDFLKEDISRLRKEADEWRDKYYRLLEEHTKEVKINRDLIAKLAEKN